MIDDEDESEPAGKEAELEPTAAPAPATATGTSTGTINLTVSAVTGTIQVPTKLSGTGVPAGTTITAQLSGPHGGAGVYTTSVATTLTAVALTFTPTGSTAFFPDFVPIVPPPVIGGTPPAFPPPAIPPPTGPLVGPAVAPAGVPPSVAGITQPVVINNPIVWPGFSTHPPSPPIVISGNNFAVAAAGQNPPWTWPPPPTTATTPCVTVSVVPTIPQLANPPRMAEEDAGAGEVPSRDPGPAKRRRRSVLPAANTHA